MNAAIVGTGPAALMAGSQLLIKGHRVTFFEHKKAAGRKFLVAGHGGFNLSHSEPEDLFLSRYSHEEIRSCVRRFGNQDLVEWLREIGIETYRGSTGKIFPVKGIKPIQVLKAWLDWLENKGAVFHYGHRMIDFTNERIQIESSAGSSWLSFDLVVLALGGGSWSKTGSDAAWIALMQEKGIEVAPLQASNAGMNYDFRQSPGELAGSVIKNIALSHGTSSRKGEITLTEYGFEGAPVYYLNGSFRNAPELPVNIDLKPQWDLQRVKEVIGNAKNPSEGLKALKLSKAAVWLLKNELTKAIFTGKDDLAEHIKQFPLKIRSLRPVEEAISTSGGIAWEALNDDMGLKKFPNVRVCGEMLDWDAPTGGYLLQACFASGFCAGQ